MHFTYILEALHFLKVNLPYTSDLDASSTAQTVGQGIVSLHLIFNRILVKYTIKKSNVPDLRYHILSNNFRALYLCDFVDYTRLTLNSESELLATYTMTNGF